MAPEKKDKTQTVWRSGAIGLVSGLKGGAAAGALGGALLMVLQVAAGEGPAVAAYTAVVGFTSGLMAGAVTGAAAGAVLGGMAGLGQKGGAIRGINLLWFGVFAVLTAFLAGVLAGGFSLAPVVLGAFCGGMGGWWGGRDFVRVVGEQDS